MAKKKSLVSCCDGRVGWFPFVLITIGVILLLDKLYIVPDAWDKLWPFLLIVIGLVSVWNAVNPRR